MKRGLVKSVLTLTLAATLMIADSGVVSAAQSVVNYTPKAAAPTSVTTAKVDKVTLTDYSDEIYVSFTGKAVSFNVYLNGEIINYIDGSYQEKWYYDEDEESSYMYISSINSSTNGTYISTYNMECGSSNKIKIVPCVFNVTTQMKEEVKSAAKEVTYKKPFGKINYFYASRSSATNNSAYKDQFVEYLYWDYSGSYDEKFEIYRSSDNKKTWKLLATTIKGARCYYDDKIEMGKTYFYKVRPVSSKGKGAFSAVSSGTEYILEGYCSLSISKNGKPVVNLGGEKGNSDATGYYVYRSDKKGSGYSKIATTYASFYVDKAAKDGKTYYYKVRPFYYDIKNKKMYEGSYSKPVGFQIQLGDHTMDLTFTYKSATSVALKWNKVSGATGYEVYYRKNGFVGSDYELLTTTTKLEYSKSGLTSGEGYTFVVRAVKKSNGQVKYYASQSFNALMGAHNPNVKITGKKFSYDKSKKTLTVETSVKWDKLYDVKSIKLKKWDSSKGEYVVVKDLGASATSYTLKRTFNAKSMDDGSYCISVTGKNNETYNDYFSGYKSLGQVSGVNVKKKNATTATISWKAATGATSYYIYRITEDGSSVWVGQTEKLTLDDKNVQPGIKYTYWVEGYNAELSCSSYNSSISHFKNTYYEQTYSDPSDLIKNTNYKAFTLTFAAPESVSVKATTKKTNTVSWKKNSIAKGYTVYRAEKKDGKYTKIGTTNASTFSFKDTKATSGKTYYYYVVATMKNDAGATVQSNVSKKISVKTK